MNAWFAIETATGKAGAVAVIRLRVDDTDGFFAKAEMRPVPSGGSGVRRVFGIDEALVARPDAGTLLIMPHGGSVIVRSIASRLAELGVAGGGVPGVGTDEFSEAKDPVEREMLVALSRAASPLAVDLLLEQPGRWRAHRPGDSLADGSVLARLIDPPLVVAAGRANIGKSSLLNAVAGDSVALAFDRPGTTRDAVGVLIDLGGLVVRWVDTPGIGSDAAAGNGADSLTAGAASAARQQLALADLVLWCVDACTAGDLGTDDERSGGLVVATRCDRGSPEFTADVMTSSATGAGIRELVHLVRESLVPAAALADPRPWRFWADGPDSA